MIKIAANPQNTLGECPLWSQTHKALFWIDIIEGKLFCFYPSGRKIKSWTIGAKTAVVVATTDRRLLLVCQNFLMLFDPETGVREVVLDFETCLPDNRPNDGGVDSAGRLWFGTTDDLEQQVSGTVYRFGPAGKLAALLKDIGNPNTFVWSPDNSRFYMADSVRQIMWVFDYDPEKGEISNRREFFSLVGSNIIPDGSAVDAEGCLWNAQWNGARIVRYRPDGGIDRIVEMPVTCPTNCAFGGEKLETLFVTSARKGQIGQQLQSQPHAGALFALNVGIRGTGQNLFDMTADIITHPTHIL